MRRDASSGMPMGPPPMLKSVGEREEEMKERCKMAKE